MSPIGLSSPLLASSSLTGGAGDVPKVNSREQAQKLAQDFEGLFLSMLVKDLRKSVDGEGLFPGDSSDTYGGMFDMFLGQHLAQNGGIGMAASIEETIAQQMDRG